MKIEVTSEVVEKSGKNDKGPWTMRQQVCYMHKNTDKYPTRVVVALDKNTAPYAPGYYTFSDSVFVTNQYGEPVLDRYNIELLPILPVSVEKKSA